MHVGIYQARHHDEARRLDDLRVHRRQACPHRGDAIVFDQDAAGTEFPKAIIHGHDDRVADQNAARRMALPAPATARPRPG